VKKKEIKLSEENTTEKENKKEFVPFANVKMNKHKMFTQGGSWIVSVPLFFAKAIETLQDRFWCVSG